MIYNVYIINIQNMSVVINFKTEDKVKKQAQKIATEMGLSLSDILNVYLRKFVKTKELHINVSETPSPYLVKSLKQSELDRKRGDVSPSFDNARDAINWLNDDNAKYENQKTKKQ